MASTLDPALAGCLSFPNRVQLLLTLAAWSVQRLLCDLVVFAITRQTALEQSYDHTV